MPALHHGNAITQSGGHSQIVGDEHNAQLEPTLQVFKQLENLYLDQRIQSGNAFVRDEYFRLHSQGTGDTDTLALDTGELMGIALERRGG